MRRLNGLTRSHCLSVWVIAVLSLGALSAPAHAATATFEIEPQDLSGALKAFAVQSHREIFFAPELARGRKSQGVKGKFDDLKALNIILEGTGLNFSVTASNAILVRDPTSISDSSREAASPSSSDDASNPKEAGKKTSQDFRLGEVDQTAAAPQVASDDQNSEKKKQEGLTEIVVTGTHIHGVPSDSSQIIVYDRAAIEQSGATTLEEFSRHMPENFASVGTLDNFNVTGPRNEGGGNGSNAAGFNLHGLGADATLTLINGHRIASGGGTTGEFVDISLIPLSAIERIEVLPDGASAIYGADAVAGVVNIILRSDYEGAETSVRYGSATAGGDQQTTVSQVVGHTWSGGSALMAYEFNKQDGLRADQRDFIPVGFAGGLSGTQIYPEQTRNSVMLTGRQDFGSGTTLTGDAMYSERRYTQGVLQPLFALLLSESGKPKEFGATVDLSHEFMENWHADLSPSFYRTDQPLQTVETVGTIVSPSTVDTRIDLTDINLHVDGTIWSFRGGPVKMALGTEFRRDTLGNTLTQNGLPLRAASSNFSRNVESGYAELLMPIVGKDNGRAGLYRLEVSLAGRYDRYNTGQSATTPRASILWSPATDLVLHGAYAQAFVAPRLDQLAVLVPQYFTTSLPDPYSPIGVADTLLREGGNPVLQPERSKTVTFGVDEKFSDIPGLSLSATYFNTVFTGQILSPPLINFTDLLHDPTLQPFVNLSPNPGEIAQLFKTGQVLDSVGSGAAGVQATLDDRYANLAVSRQSGLDASATYNREVRLGTVGVTLAGTYLIKYETRNTPTVPTTVLRNELGEPVNLRANAILTWSLHGLSTALSIHYVNHYENSLFTPAQTISSWTTADLHVGYEFSNEVTHGVLRGFAVTLDARNLMDRPPPSVNLPVDNNPGFNPGFDGANADPLGRVISLQLRKRW